MLSRETPSAGQGTAGAVHYGSSWEYTCASNLRSPSLFRPGGQWGHSVGKLTTRTQVGVSEARLTNILFSVDLLYNIEMVVSVFFQFLRYSG